jgi:hypothetical protein
MRSLSASTTSFMKPSVSLRSRARPMLSISSLPTSSRLPVARASCSLKPALPSGGSMKSA